MAHCKQTPEELVQEVFSPVIAVLCSPEAQVLCKKNNLTFAELLQPFCRLNTEASIRDLSLISCPVRGLRLIIRDMHTQPVTLAVSKRMMADAVTNTPGDSGLKQPITVLKYSINYCNTTPWFEAYRNVFFQVFYPAEHEFINRFLGCMFVVSSDHPDPLTRFNELIQEQLHFQQNGVNRWFTANICKYFILLHDVSSAELTRAEATYQSMKSSYGSTQCHLLQINSQTPQMETEEEMGNLPDPWKQFLTPASSPNTHDQNWTAPEAEEATVQVETETQNAQESSGEVHPLSSNNFESLSPPEEKGVTEEDWAQAGAHRKGGQYRGHGLCLTAGDRDHVRNLIHEFCLQCLIPYAEKQIRLLNDQLMNRKGLHKSFFNATKKWFGSGKTGQHAPTSSANSVVYSHDAPELQVRKLGDLAFMFQLYEVAYQAYHSAKKDFEGDQAWIHYAGALEMAALSVFMQGSQSQRQLPYHYLDNAINTYVNTCKLPLYGVRATLLSTETLKSASRWCEAAQQLIRLTSEESDLRSALLLEQAALCFLHAWPHMARKYAFHIILAGHRFSKAAQRKHALRCYQQAAEVYQQCHWVLANDHINFTIGRQSLNLKQLRQSLQAFQCLLQSRKYQTASQQTTYLKEYLFVLKQLLTDNKEEIMSLTELPVPVIKLQETQVLLGHISCPGTDDCIIADTGSFSLGEDNTSLWLHLEELTLVFATGSELGVRFINLQRPQLSCLTSRTNNTVRPVAVKGETLTVELCLENPLQIPIMLSNAHLLWEFSLDSQEAPTQPLNNQVVTGKTALLDEVMETEILPEVRFDSLQVKKLHFSLLPQQTGQLTITGLTYTLHSVTSTPENEDGTGVIPTLGLGSALSIRGKQDVKISGPRLNNTKADKMGQLYGPDFRLSPVIIHEMPNLQAKFYGFPTVLLCGEVKLVTVEFSNLGQCLLHRLLVASPNPEMFVFGSCGTEDLDIPFGTNGTPKHSPVMVERQRIDRVTELFGADGRAFSLDTGQSIKVPLWIRGPDEPGEHNLDLLFYYETSQRPTKLKYRLLPYSFVLFTSPSLALSADARRSHHAKREQGMNSLVLSLQIENAMKSNDPGAVDLSVVHVSGASENWWISPIPGSNISGAVHLKPAESLWFNMQALPFTAKNTVASKQVWVFSQVPLERSTVDSSSSPCSDFCLRSLLDLGPLQTVKDPAPAAAAAPPSSAGQETTNFSTEDEAAIQSSNVVNLTLTVLWKAAVQRHGKVDVVFGQHHFTIERLLTFKPFPATVVRPVLEKPIMSSESFKAFLTQKLVKCVLHHKIHVEHNFKTSKLAIVPVSLSLTNCCDNPVLVDLDLSSFRTSDRAAQEPASQQGSQFIWLGPTHRIVNLQPLSSAHVCSLRAAFSRPGTFNMSNIKVGVRTLSQPAQSGPMLQEAQAPSLLVITDSQ